MCREVKSPHLPNEVIHEAVRHDVWSVGQPGRSATRQTGDGKHVTLFQGVWCFGRCCSGIARCKARRRIVTSKSIA